MIKKTIIHVFDNAKNVFFETISDLSKQDIDNAHKFYIKSGTVPSHAVELQVLSKADFFAELALSRTTVVFHSLGSYNLFLLKLIKKKYKETKVIWSFWSYEYYQLPFNLKQLFSSTNKKYFYRKWISVLSSLVKESFQIKTIPTYLFSRKKYQDLIGQIDVFVSFLPDDFEQIYTFPNQVKYIQVSYLNWDSLNKNVSNSVQKTKLFIGHSAYAYLNHYLVLEELSKSKVLEEIIIPLNYGNEAYRNNLIHDIPRKYPELKVSFLTEYMMIDEYYSLISSALAYIHASNCQNGLGNILFYLLNGTSVYLNEHTSTYLFFKKLGIKLFTLDELKNGIQELNADEQENNYQCVEKLFKSDLLIQNWSVAWDN